MIHALKKVIRHFSKIKYPDRVIGNVIDSLNYGSPQYSACSAGSNYLTFNVEGNLVPCQMSINSKGFGSDSDLLNHNINNNPLSKINDVRLKNSCNDCTWKYICCGGCPYLSKIQYGDATHPTPFCSVNKSIVTELLKLEAVRMIRYGQYNNV